MALVSTNVRRDAAFSSPFHDTKVLSTTGRMRVPTKLINVFLVKFIITGGFPTASNNNYYNNNNNNKIIRLRTHIFYPVAIEQEVHGITGLLSLSRKSADGSH